MDGVGGRLGGPASRRNDHRDDCILSLLGGDVGGRGARGRVLRDERRQRLSGRHAHVLFSGLAALVVGPVFGLAASVVRHGRGLLGAAACGVPAGPLVGEGAYGLVVDADTTNPSYWWAELVTGVVLLAVQGAVRLRRPGALAIAVVAAVVATVVFTLFTVDVLTVF